MATRIRIDIEGEFLTPGEVSRLLRVDPKTVTRWGRSGKLRCIATPGGHRRYFKAEVEEFLNRPARTLNGAPR